MEKNSSQNSRARLKLDMVELEFEGNEEFVQSNSDKYFSQALEAAKALQSFKSDTIVIENTPRQLPLEMASGTSDTRQDDDVPENLPKKVNNGNLNTNTPLDFPTFYRKKNPQSQWQEVLVISYYYQSYGDYEYLGYKDLDEAYLRLQRVGVDEPRNARQAVKEACNQKLLYKPERKRGKFALTDQGFEFVEKMTGLDTKVNVS